MFEIGGDGNIAAEWTQMEILMDAQYNSVTDESSGTNAAFWCEIKQNPMYECLDIGASSTLARGKSEGGFFNGSWTSAADRLSVNIYSENGLMQKLSPAASLYNTTAATNLFGVDDTCNQKIVGDGVVNGFDMFILATAYFRTGPYAIYGTEVPLDSIATVQGREGLASHCSTNTSHGWNSRLGWQLRISWDACYSKELEADYVNQFHQSDGPLQEQSGRRLSVAGPGMHELDASLVVRSDPEVEEGMWVTVFIPSNVISTDIFVAGFEEAFKVPLDNVAAPPYGTTFVPPMPHLFQVRFERHIEIAGLWDNRCAAVSASGGAFRALHRGTLSVSQLVTADRPRLCAFNLVVWVPKPNSRGIEESNAWPATGSTWDVDSRAETLSLREASWNDPYMYIRATSMAVMPYRERRVLANKDDSPCAMRIEAGSSVIDGVAGKTQRVRSCLSLTLPGHPPLPSPPSPPTPAFAVQIQVDIDNTAAQDLTAGDFEQAVQAAGEANAPPEATVDVNVISTATMRVLLFSKSDVPEVETNACTGLQNCSVVSSESTRRKLSTTCYVVKLVVTFRPGANSSLDESDVSSRLATSIGSTVNATYDRCNLSVVGNTSVSTTAYLEVTTVGSSADALQLVTDNLTAFNIAQSAADSLGIDATLLEVSESTVMYPPSPPPTIPPQAPPSEETSVEDRKWMFWLLLLLLLPICAIMAYANRKNRVAALNAEREALINPSSMQLKFGTKQNRSKGHLVDPSSDARRPLLDLYVRAT